MFTCSLGAQPSASSSDPPAQLGSRVDEFIRAEMTRQKIPGLAIAIMDKGRVATKTYGLANVEHNVPVTDRTIFQSGSLGKMFTAAAVMLLIEEGKLKLTVSIT